MTDTPKFHGDPDGLFAADTKLVEQDHIEKRVVLEGLTDEQIDTVGKAIATALSPYKSRTAQYISKAIQLAVGSVVISGLAWTTAYIITNFPTTNR